MQTTESPLGIFIFPAPPPNTLRCWQNAHYLTEILDHAGLPYRALEADELAKSLNPDLKVLVTAGDGVLEPATRTAFRDWVENGGCWLSLGSLCGLEEVLGAEGVAVPGAGIRASLYPQSTLGEGYLKPSSLHPVLEHTIIPLHFFNGVTVRATGEATKVLARVLDAHGRETDAPALLERSYGAGRSLLVAPDAVNTIVRIGQGISVTADGVSAPDGSAPVTDGVLKCDDGLVLDWHFDRQEIPDTDGLKGFLEPIADQWRELILRAIFYFCEISQISLPVLWLYPRNLPAMAHLSHDTDENDLPKGERLLEVMAQAGIHSTWCTITPGYPRPFMEKIKLAGHELSLHYNALDCPWSEEEFSAQYHELRELFGEDPVSNKNHYTRWEGSTEFFDWCARKSIWLDQTKGPSKPGEIGFTFGSAQLYFPLCDDGTIHSVLEQPMHTQDLLVAAPPQIVPVLLDAVVKHHGILHLLFHPAHIQTEGVAEALLDAVRQAEERGLEWRTARWFNDWERARRAVTWEEITADGDPEVLLSPLSDATVLVLGRHERIKINGQLRAAEVTTRWGFEFTFVILE